MAKSSLSLADVFSCISPGSNFLCHFNHRANGPKLAIVLVITSSKRPLFPLCHKQFWRLIFLISYPFAIEPNCSLSYQLNAISVAYAAFAALTTICAWLTYKCAAPDAVSDENYEQIEKELLKQEPKNSQYALWLLLTALPSSLMLGLTNYVTSDLASLPLFFVVPLAIYMLTFTLAFAIDFSRVLKAMVIMSAISAIGIFIFLFNETRITNGETVMTGFITSGISLHLICLFITSLTCHAKVAVSRPAPAFLTLVLFSYRTWWHTWKFV